MKISERRVLFSTSFNLINLTEVTFNFLGVVIFQSFSNKKSLEKFFQLRSFNAIFFQKSFRKSINIYQLL